MRRVLTTLLLGACAIVVAGCGPRPSYSYRHPMSDRDAWEIVRNDPCRYDEYRGFADEHKNPDKRRAEVWRLAHEGCNRERRHNQQNSPGYYDDYR